MGLGDRAQDVASGISGSTRALGDALRAPFGDSTVRLGVTGLSRAGKTVFITSLVANLMDRGRMPQLVAAASGAIRAAYLQPQPDDTLPRFDYETHLAALTAPQPHWPESTRHVSQLRLSLRLQPSGLFGALRAPRTVHLDITDYPGEWLLDLGLLEKSYESWSAEVLARMARRAQGAGYLSHIAPLDAGARLSEPVAQDLAQRYRAYLHAAQAAGCGDGTPGRFLLPGDLEGAPVLTFAPLPRPDKAGRASLWHEMARRFEAYKSRVVKPFFRTHFARIDRQIVLVDVLGAIHDGPAALEDTRQSMAEILRAFQPGRNRFLSRLWQGTRVERILFAATKADDLHHSQHPALTAITEALMREARDRADFAGARTEALSIAALRATVETTLTHDGRTLDCVRGILQKTGKPAALYAGALPEDPAAVLNPARQGAQKWLDADFRIMDFAPPVLHLRPGEGPPHIRLDRAAQFLFGDKL